MHCMCRTFRLNNFVNAVSRKTYRGFSKPVYIGIVHGRFDGENPDFLIEYPLLKLQCT